MNNSVYGKCFQDKRKKKAAKAMTNWKGRYRLEPIQQHDSFWGFSTRSNGTHHYFYESTSIRWSEYFWYMQNYNVSLLWLHKALYSTLWMRKIYVYRHGRLLRIIRMSLRFLIMLQITVGVYQELTRISPDFSKMKTLANWCVTWSGWVVNVTPSKKLALLMCKKTRKS